MILTASCLFDSYCTSAIHADHMTEHAHLFSLSALSPLHYSEVIYNACGVMIPWYTSRVIIKQAASRAL